MKTCNKLYKGRYQDKDTKTKIPRQKHVKDYIEENIETIIFRQWYQDKDV